MISPKAFLLKRLRSLRLAMFYAVLGGLVLALCSFVSLKLLSDTLIERVYLSEENRIEREENFAQELQNYVDENQLSSVDTEALERWVRGNRYLYVMIYKGDKLFFEAGDFEDDLSPSDESNTEGEEGEQQRPGAGITVELPTKEDLVKFAEENGSHVISFSDTNVIANMADYSEYLYYELANILSLVISMLLLVVVIMIYANRVTGRVTRLAKKVRLAAEGDMESPIVGEGYDEIYHLAGNVDYMRSSVLRNLSKEKEAREANVELITSMSHDIRTPLTVLLGYFELMREHNKDETMGEYIDASERTALRMKELSDDMFRYFLLFAEEQSDTPLDSYDAATLIEQIVYEHVLLFREKGYLVECKFSLRARRAFSSYEIITDAQSLMRVVENLMSNWAKYADKSRPVSIYFDFTEEKYKLLFTNHIDRAPHAESNGIGVRTCKKLSSRILCDFEIEQDGEIYRTGLVFITKRRDCIESAEPPVHDQEGDYDAL